MEPLPVPKKGRTNFPVVRPSLRAAAVPVDEGPTQPAKLPFRWIGAGLLILISSVVGITLGLINTNHGSSGGAASGSGSEGRSEPRPVAVAYVDVEGGIRALTPTMAGRVKALPVEEGKEVPEGELLLQLDDEQYQIDLDRARSDLEAAKERLTQARKLESQKKTQLEAQQLAIEAAETKKKVAIVQAERAERLYNKGLKGGSDDVRAAQLLVEEATKLIQAEKAKLRLLKEADPTSPVRLAELDIKAKQKQIEKANLAIKECQVRAPCRGKILRKLVNVGELLGPAGRGPAFQFCPSGDRIVRAEVEQDFGSQIKIGMEATIEDDAKVGDKWEGEVVAISDWYTQRRRVMLEPMQFNDVRTLEVVIRLKRDARSALLRIDQRVRVTIKGVDLN